MKRSYYYILAALICCILTGCKENSNEVVITGRVEGVEDGVVINLMKTEGRIFVNLQSDTVINGSFRFSFADTVDIPESLNIMANGEGFPPTWLEIWVVPGVDIKITGKDKLLRSWDVSSNVPEQQELNKYNAKINPYERTTQTVMREAYDYFDKMNEFPERRAEFKAKIDSLYAINDSLNILITEAEIDIMDTNKTYSPVWMKKLDRYASALKYTNISEVYAEKLKNMYEEMSDDLKNGKEGQSIYINLYPPVTVKEGDDMADADLWNLEGELCRLADYKGRYLLLDFWSAGCGPCMMAVPEMKEISEMYKERLVVISISSDPKSVWENVSKEKDITWVNLNDFKGENGIKLRYGVRGIPYYVMISPEGKITASWFGYGKGLLKGKMKELIK